MPLRVAVTGPTGEIGISTIEALESHPDVAQIVGMARRPFDPAERGWSKTVYRQGDILDREAVDALVADADVVVHLAFIVLGSRQESRPGEPGRHPQRIRGDSGRPMPASRLHLVGGRLRLPLRQSGSDHRGCSGARVT